MKCYLGNKYTVFSGAMMPFLAIIPLGLVVFMLNDEVSAATVLLSVFMLFASIVWLSYLYRVRHQVYCWGNFQSEQVLVELFGRQLYRLEYSKCRSCGIGSYVHGLLYSKIGPKVYFIFLSYDVFPEEYRNKINLWHVADTQVKVHFSAEVYAYLLNVLPPKQAKMLRKDYENIFV